MRQFTLQKPKKIQENRKLLEKKLKVKFFIEGRKLAIEGSEIDEFIASKVIEASELGFPVETCLLLADVDNVFEKVEIKNLTKRNNLVEVRARIIGKDGRTKALIEELSDCWIVIKDNEVGVIGQADRIKICMQAVTKLIQGSKQSSVYAYLEKQRKIFHPEDLGLKIEEEIEKE